jgi:CheY-like chemotaxis protein
MALRVLVADESATIKKVIQLALQDFGVTVKSIPVGNEVLELARSFRPDVVFADVLLSKKNGYDIAEEFKQDPQLRSVPVVLMWSGFVSFDEARFQSCGAVAKLEKPFDADTLRRVVQDHVLKAKTNLIAPFVSVDLPDFVESSTSVEAPPAQNPAAATTPAFPSTHAAISAPLDLDSESLATSSLAAVPNSLVDTDLSTPTETHRESALAAGTERSDIESWQARPIELDEPALEEEAEEFQQVQLARSPRPSPASQAQYSPSARSPLESRAVTPSGSDIWDPSQIKIVTTNREELSLEELTKTARASGGKKIEIPKVKPVPHGVDPARLEQIVQAQVREVIKEIAWQVIPDLAERIIREEIRQLMLDAEKLP